jgi:hypothetical protein
MSYFLINLVFAGIFLWLAWRTLPRSFTFLRLGWLLIRTQSEKPGFREAVRADVETRRAISIGGGYVLGGMVWLAGGLIFTGLGLLLAFEAVRTSGFLPAG